MAIERCLAIDGPAGSGKSTVANLCAEKTGLTLLDTGAMYRALAWYAVDQGLSLVDEKEISVMAEDLQIDYDEQGVSVNGQHLGDRIRSLEVGQAASNISTFAGVRKALVAAQRATCVARDCVLEGRDTTTVVAPEAKTKVFLTASIEERAKRRWLEMKQSDPGLDLREVVRDVVIRDHRDYTRNESPLQLAEDALIMESFGISASEIAQWICQLYAQNLHR